MRHNKSYNRYRSGSHFSRRRRRPVGYDDTRAGGRCAAAAPCRQAFASSQMKNLTCVLHRRYPYLFPATRGGDSARDPAHYLHFHASDGAPPAARRAYGDDISKWSKIKMLRTSRTSLDKDWVVEEPVRGSVVGHMLHITSCSGKRHIINFWTLGTVMRSDCICRWCAKSERSVATRAVEGVVPSASSALESASSFHQAALSRRSGPHTVCAFGPLKTRNLENTS
ncbi:hypothetical protein EVAR_17621_1 [Eumeta japonica]|uniref:Uncharacterized protein n=1 Tax=Eumeta variegata TaxID=151549 RepID=A0A4C1UC17_EUMVA|nr:hypothetical protein EVAR_17621_1 [Eumeta japonica]